MSASRYTAMRRTVVLQWRFPTSPLCQFHPLRKNEVKNKQIILLQLKINFK